MRGENNAGSRGAQTNSSTPATAVPYARPLSGITTTPHVLTATDYTPPRPPAASADLLECGDLAPLCNRHGVTTNAHSVRK